MDRRDASEAYLQPPLPTFPQAPEGEMAWRNPDLQTPHGEMASWFPQFLRSLFPGGGNRDTAETLGNLLTFGAAIGVPGGAPKSKPYPKPVDLRKIANDYARFVMGKGDTSMREPDPRFMKQLQRASTLQQEPPFVPYGTGGAVPTTWWGTSESDLADLLNYRGIARLPFTMPATKGRIPLMEFRD